MQQSEIREKCAEYTLKMENIIRQNTLKYKGLNVYAKEFIPSNTICIQTIEEMDNIVRQKSLKYKGLNVFAKEFIPSKSIHIKTTEEMENEFFNNLEMEFVRKNTYFFD
jgi:hypothetical protein